MSNKNLNKVLSAGMASSKSIWHNSDSFFCFKETLVFAFFSVCKGAFCFQERLPIDRFVDEH